MTNITGSLYRDAWELLLKYLETKTTWGRNELKELMLKSLIEAGKGGAGQKI